MKVLLRVDSSRLIGTGHVFRCLTLAQELGARGARVTAVCRDLPGNLAAVFRDAGFELAMLPAPQAARAEVPAPLTHADWLGTSWEHDAEETSRIARRAAIDCLIVDHYALDQRWETAVTGGRLRTLVIDDVADRPHACDLLLDQNLHAGMEQRYADLVPPACRLLLGPKYALLRRQFRRPQPRPRDGSIHRIFVSLGGVDLTHQTQKALAALRSLAWSQPVDVIIGGSNPFAEAIQRACAALPQASVHRNLSADGMAELMEAADLAIGAPGTSTWERCSLGLPALTIATAENQRSIGRAAAAAGALVDLGWHEEVSAERIESTIRQCMMDPAGLRRMSAVGRELVDGCGVTRVADAIEAVV